MPEPNDKSQLETRPDLDIQSDATIVKDLHDIYEQVLDVYMSKSERAMLFRRNIIVNEIQFTIHSKFVCVGNDDGMICISSEKETPTDPALGVYKTMIYLHGNHSGWRHFWRLFICNIKSDCGFQYIKFT